MGHALGCLRTEQTGTLMGAANALSAFHLYAARIPATSFKVLTYMALVSLDNDPEPWWSEGHEVLASMCFGYAEPDSDAALRAVRRAVTPLFAARAITVTRRSSGHGNTDITVRYRLWLRHSAPDENRPVDNGPEGASHGSLSVLCTTPRVGRKVTARRTVFVPAQDENRPPKEEEEKEELDTPLAFDLNHPGSARTRAEVKGGISFTSSRQDVEAERRRQADELTRIQREQDAAALAAEASA